MSVVAWDGKTLAAYKRVTCAGLANTTTKIRQLGDGCILAWTGDQDAGELLAQWFTNGADPATWPEVQKDKDNWCRLIVVDKEGAWSYERQPVRVRIEAPFMAWGSGRDFAMAGMYLGLSAREAVELACRFQVDCGNGVDVFTLAHPGRSSPGK